MRLLPICFYLFCFFSVTSAFTQKGNYSETLTFKKGKSNTSFQIINKNDNSVELQLDLNHQFPLTVTTIIKKVRGIAKRKGISEIKAAWEYVTTITNHEQNRVTNENWMNNPDLFYNSIGEGQCSNLASNLASIWKSMGYRVKVYSLWGHVVPEVKDATGWHMYDPDLRVYYCDSTGRVLSVEELIAEPDRISQPRNDCGFYLNPFFKKDTIDEQKYAAIYASKTDNEDQTKWHLGYPSLNSKWILPSNSKMIITSRKCKGFNDNYITMKLTKKSTGRIQLPFVVKSIKGNVNISYNNLSNIDIKNIFQFTTQEQINSITINQVFKPTEIIYKINDNLELFSDKNVVEVASNYNLDVKQGGKTDYVSDSIFDYNQLFETHALDYFSFYDQLNEFPENYSQFNDFVKQKYKQFLDSDLNAPLSKKEKKHLLSKMEDVIDGFPSIPQKFYNRIKPSLPNILYKVFVISIYDSENQYFEMLKKKVIEKIS